MKWRQALIALLIFLLPFLVWALLSTGKTHYKRLPILGPYEVPRPGDTVWHTLPPFSLLSQDSLAFTLDSLKGRIHIANYFFTRCPGICPRLSQSMARLQAFLKDKPYRIRLVSYTIDPLHDTPSILRQYGQQYGADFARWTFVTGAETTLYRLAVKGYLIPVDRTGDTTKGELGYIHSDMLILVDPTLRIRGFYSGIDSTQVQKLMDDINLLLLEEKANFTRQ
ncbi:MAG: SCO family protein [Bacteroidia bacterium]|nr:SCO family protein [Bacteroidia bacterium]MDW8015577.1 SCO family protein [Bacteroidia bacterium]